MPAEAPCKSVPRGTKNCHSGEWSRIVTAAESRLETIGPLSDHLWPPLYRGRITAVVLLSFL